MKTELEMQKEEVPTFESLGELNDYIKNLVDQEHDYGTRVYAMSMAATAAFNYVANQLGVTGFQSSIADLDILRRTRRMEGPFMLIDGDKMLYPQYDLHRQLDEALEEWEPWAAKEAKKKLEEDDYAHPDVKKHWEDLANGI